MGVGNIRKFLLKTPAQREQARASIAAHAEVQADLEELSQINTELLRRGELLDASPP
jgi:flagellar biosynthesis/type III secretory pathway chaperone